MTDTDVIRDDATTSAPARADLKLEVVVMPVSDVDRAKQFYEGLGWRLDADFPVGDDFRVVQLTPPGSPASIIFGDGVTSAAPGSVDGLQLVVSDIGQLRVVRLVQRSRRQRLDPPGGDRAPAGPRHRADDLPLGPRPRGCPPARGSGARRARGPHG